MSEVIENNEPQEPVEPSLLAGQPVEPTEPKEPTVQPEVINSIDDYKVDVEGFNYDDFKAIPENQEFLERAKEAGLDNKTLNFALKEYNDIIQNVMGANAAMDAEACTAEMKQAWGADADANFTHAHTAANHLINNGILTADDVNNPSFGNNPLVLKMAAYLGSQLSEDAPPRNTQQSGGEDIQSLIASEAYTNERHPDHKRVYAQVQKAYEKQYN